MLSPKFAAASTAVFLGSVVLGYWLVFTLSFFEDVLPHGGMW